MSLPSEGPRIGFYSVCFQQLAWYLAHNKIVKLVFLRRFTASLSSKMLFCLCAFLRPCIHPTLPSTLCFMSVFSVYKKIRSAAARQLEKQSWTGAKRFCASDKQGGEPPASCGYVGRGLNHRVLWVPWKKITQRNITQHGEMRRISRDMKMTKMLKNLQS